MISKRLSDGSCVTTPLYAGSEDQIEKMIDCDHDYLPGTEIHESTGTVPKQYVILELCRKCGAARSRHGEDRTVLEKYLASSDTGQVS